MDTLRDDSTGKRLASDYVVLVGGPVLIAAFLVWRSVHLSATIANVVITALAIFAGLLFNLLLLAHQMIRAAAAGGAEKKLIREIYSNISFAILSSIVVIILAMLSYFSPRPQFMAAISAVTYFLLANFLLTLLMILQRIHGLLKREFERS